MNVEHWNNAKFRLGDQVRISVPFGDFKSLDGAVGFVTEIDDTDYPYLVETDNGTVWFREAELTLA